MSTATQTPPTDAPDLDGIERDALAQLDDLRQAQQRLALDALTDDDAAAELAEVQAEIARANAAIEQVGLARIQAAHLAETAEREREHAKRDRALAEAAHHQKAKRTAAQAVDDAALALCAALKDYSEADAALHHSLSRAGQRPLHTLAGAPVSALLHAMFASELPRGLIEFGGIHPKPVKLADSVPSIIGEDE